MHVRVRKSERWHECAYGLHFYLCSLTPTSRLLEQSDTDIRDIHLRDLSGHQIVVTAKVESTIVHHTLTLSMFGKDSKAEPHQHPSDKQTNRHSEKQTNRHSHLVKRVPVVRGSRRVRVCENNPHTPDVPASGREILGTQQQGGCIVEVLAVGCPNSPCASGNNPSVASPLVPSRQTARCEGGPGVRLCVCVCVCVCV